VSAMKKGAVLVIEDETSVLAFVRIALERKGYEVVGVPTGALGLEMLASRDFAGIISDMRTPGGVNGDDVYYWVTRNRPELANRVLFVTGDTVNPQTVRALRLTGAPYIEKPFRMGEFLDLVQKVIGTAND